MFCSCLPVQEHHWPSMDLKVLIRKKGPWATCFLGFLLTPKTYIFCEPQRAGAPEGTSATDPAKAAEIYPAGHRVPLLTTCREAACWRITGLSLLARPPCPGIYPTALRASEDMEDVIWPRMLGPVSGE